MEKAELFIFDLDGTLIEFHSDFLFSETKRILDLIQHSPVPDNELKDSFAAFEFFRFFESEKEKNTDLFWNHFDWNSFPRPKVLPGALELLKNLKDRNSQVAICTSRLCTEDELRADLQGTRILDYVDFIVTRLDPHMEWSDKRGHFNRLFSQVEVSPKDAIMFGDIPPDIYSAKDSKVGKTVAVLSGGIRKDVLEVTRPDFLLDSVLDAIKLL